MINILYPTDFSDKSIEAVDFAMKLAKQTGGALHLLHVNSLPIISTDMPVDAMENIISSQEKSSKEKMDKLITGLGKHEISVKPIIKTGLLADTVHEICEEKGIHMIVMTTHGAHGFFERFFMGSNTEKIARSTEVPILVLPENSKYQAIKKILYATSLDEDDSNGLKSLRKIALALGSRVSAAHVENEKMLNIFSDEKLVKRMKEILHEDKLKIHSIKTDNIRDGLEKFAEKNNYDVLAATRIDRGMIDNFFHTSITSALVYNSKMPLLILHN